MAAADNAADVVEKECNTYLTDSDKLDLALNDW